MKVFPLMVLAMAISPAKLWAAWSSWVEPRRVLLLALLLAPRRALHRVLPSVLQRAPRRVPQRVPRFLATSALGLGLGLGLAMSLPRPAAAAVRVLACEPEWAALVQELAGPLAEVSVATTALQDPHQIQAKPSLIARTRNADLVVCTGAELEVGWLPVLLQQSGNARVQAGQPGNFAAAEGMRLLDAPGLLDRAQGDVHAAGNPHIQTDPRNIAQVAQALAARLQQVDPSHAADYARRLADFNGRWQQAMARWNAQAAPLKGVAVVSQHKAFVYLVDWLGLKEVAVLEPKPGVEPSAAHLQTVLAALKGNPARMVLYAAYQDGRPSEWLSRNAGVTAVKLPFTVGGTEAAKDLFGLFDDTLARLLAGLATQ